MGGIAAGGGGCALGWDPAPPLVALSIRYGTGEAVYVYPHVRTYLKDCGVHDVVQQQCLEECVTELRMGHEQCSCLIRMRDDESLWYTR